MGGKGPRSRFLGVGYSHSRDMIGAPVQTKLDLELNRLDRHRSDNSRMRGLSESAVIVVWDRFDRCIEFTKMKNQDGFDLR